MVSRPETRKCVLAGPGSPCGIFLLLMETGIEMILICEVLVLMSFKPHNTPPPAGKGWETQTEG